MCGGIQPPHNFLTLASRDRRYRRRTISSRLLRAIANTASAQFPHACFARSQIQPPHNFLTLASRDRKHSLRTISSRLLENSALAAQYISQASMTHDLGATPRGTPYKNLVQPKGSFSHKYWGWTYLRPKLVFRSGILTLLLMTLNEFFRELQYIL